MSTDIKLIKKNLDALEQELIAKVPEHLFIQHILPIMAADEGHVDLEVWNHLAGSIFNKMSVIDATGKVLFTLPPLATSPVTQTNRDPKKAMFEIVAGFEARSLVSPMLGARYFDHMLADCIEIAPRDLETLLLVDEILVRYDRKPHLPPDYVKLMSQAKAAKEAKESPTEAAGAADPENETYDHF